MGRMVWNKKGEVFRVLVEYRREYEVYVGDYPTGHYAKVIRGEREIYGPWGKINAASAKYNELVLDMEQEAKRDPSFELFTLEKQKSVKWERV